MWVAIEGATVGSVLLVGIARTTSAIEASWKYLILGSVGLGFALFATLLAYASSVPVLGDASDALSWSRLVDVAPSLDPTFLRLAFVFALVGYRHQGRPRALPHMGCPTPTARPRARCQHSCRVPA